MLGCGSSEPNTGFSQSSDEDVTQDASLDLRLDDPPEADTRALDSDPTDRNMDAGLQDERTDEHEVVPIDQDVEPDSWRTDSDVEEQDESVDEGLESDDIAPDRDLEDDTADAFDWSTVGLGTCTAAFGEGDECPDSDARACFGPLRCISGTCRTESTSDQPCGSQSDCADDLYCDRYTDEGARIPSPVCRLELAIDEPCYASDSSCQSPLRCIRSTCRVKSSAGGECESNGDCENDLYCDELNDAGEPVDGTCLAELGLDHVCDSDDDGCAYPLNCVDGQCAERGVEGDPCQYSFDCSSAFYCDRYNDDGGDRVQRICLPEITEGAACDDRESGNCDSSDCLAGMCRDDVPMGGPCDSSFDCDDGMFCLE